MSLVRRRRRRLLAVMFTDMSGFSELSARDEDVALDLLAAHNRIMKRAVVGYRGKVIKSIGDAILGSFDAASDALDAGIAMQQAIVRYNRGRPRSHQIRVRIGVHVGDVVVTSDDIYGVVVNVAKGLESVGVAGEVCCSEAARLMVMHLPRYHFRHKRIMKTKGSAGRLVLYTVFMRNDPKDGEA